MRKLYLGISTAAASMLLLVSCNYDAPLTNPGGNPTQYPPSSGPGCQIQCQPAPASTPGSIILDSSCNPAVDTTGTDTLGEKVQCDSGIAQDSSDNGPTWETP